MNVDINKLKRNYKEQPLSSTEIISRDDLVELYVNQNLTTRDLIKFFHIGTDRVVFWLKYHGLKKTKEDINKKISETLKSEESKQKARLSNLLSCGYENPAQNPINTLKAKATKKQKYGDENFNNRTKAEQTCQDKYGYSHVMKVPEIRKNVDTTCIRKYGNRCSAQGKEQRKQADEKNERLYGSKNVLISPIIKEKIRKTINTEEYKKRKSETMRRLDVQNKINKSKKEHNSFVKSNDEEKVYIHLKSIFPKVERQYRSEEYPFNCDFYVPSKDLYIECNFNWTHGFKPFDVNNKTDIQKALSWLEKAEEKNFKNKNKRYYINAYKVWVVTDVRKRETARQNKLNWLEFFNMEQFYAWFSKQSHNKINIDIEKEIPRLLQLCRQSEFHILERGVNGLIYKYHPSIWDCKTLNSRLSPREAFNNDQVLLRAIRNLCKYMPQFIHREDVVHKICQRFSIAKISKPITVFKPTESLRLLKKYAQDSELIVNPMSGYSAHLIASHKLGIKYEGYDLNPITVSESQKIIEDFKMNATVKIEDILKVSKVKNYSDKTTLICCPPYLSDKGEQLETWGQELANLQSNQWCIEILKRYNCGRYIFIINRNEGFEKYTVEVKNNGTKNSHINSDTKQYIIVLNRQQRDEIIL